MKQGWEIKRLEELAIKLFAGGDKPKVFSEHPTGSLNIPVYANGVSLNGLVGYTDKAIVDKESITISARGTIGFCCIRQTPFVPIVRLITIIPTEEIRTRYLYYALSNATIENNGVAIPQLTIPMIKGIPIPVPPREEQERIVAELDCLSGVIEKKREQLKGLDALAQSIFYQMFGDPITNEKGWEVKKLGEVTILYNGRAFKPTDWSENGLPIVRIQNLNNRNASYNLYNGEVSNAHRLYGGELLYAWSGTPDTSFGAHIWYGTDAVLNQHIFKVEFDDNVLNKKFFLFLLNSQVHSMFDQTHGGVGLQHITKGTLTSQNVIIPHLALQKQFAEKIEKIEQQKKLISQSIKEVEDLFNSRMSYYFN